ncbi:hypothetical protein ABPG72_009651 [Tetrahymena utriculariae]
MGQLLEKANQKQISQTLEDQLFSLKKITLKELYECIEIIDQQYPTSYRLFYEEFDQIFGILMDDTEPIFNKLSEQVSNNKELKMADVYECLACFALFSGDTFENKIQFVYRLFDFDSSNTIEKQELIFTISSVIKSLCKVVGVPVPKIEFLESLADACFLMIDKDHSRHIDFEEFADWINRNFEFQDFLLKFSGTQSYPNAKKRMKEIISEYDQDFMRQSKGQVVIKGDQLKELLYNQLSEFEDEELIGYLFSVIVETSKRFQDMNVYQDDIKDLNIHKRDYLDVMRAWCAFSASDFNNKNRLSVQDLRILLWIYEDEEPNTFKVIAEMNNIDEDQSKTIDRKEWIRYLCSEDRTGGHVFKSNLKRNFEKFEKPTNGLVDVSNIKEILTEVFREKIVKSKKNRTALDNINKLIDKLCIDITKDLRQKELTELGWGDFRNYIDQAIDKNKKLCQYLDQNI